MLPRRYVNIALAFLVGFLIAFTAFYKPICSAPYEHGRSENSNNAEQLPEQGFWCRTYMNAEAFWGMIGVFVGIIGVVYVARQIRQGQLSIEKAENASAQASMDAQRATAETRRSVNAYIEAERGRLGLDRIYRNTDGNRYHFDLRNMGNSALHVIDIRGGSMALPEGQPFYVLQYPENLPEALIAMAAGDRLTTNHHLVADGIIHRLGPELAIELKQPLEEGQRLVLYVFGRYKSLGSFYEFMITILMNKNGSYTIKTESDLTYERQIER